ncbi:MAG: nicotinate-nucleotide adenylyltransferase [Thermodesulfobacteriota bacterium]
MSVGILGGSFNPVHNGHLRLALESLEQLELGRVDFVPALYPPHKSSHHLLPFDLRYSMLQQAVSGVEGVDVSDLEGRRNAPSYTVDTLQEYKRLEPGREIYFILGCNDFLTLPHWQDWGRLFELTNFVVVGRQGLEREQIQELLHNYFQGEFKRDNNGTGWTVGETTRILYLEIPRLEISSTLIRSRWSSGRSLKFLLPQCVEDLLYQNREIVTW